MGNIASIHIERGHIGEFWHNDRSKPTKNSIFADGEVLCDKTAREGIELYRKVTAERAKKYTERTGQKLQKKAVTLLSAVVNIKDTTTLADLQRLGNKLEEKLGTKILQIAIHRDEGHITESGEKVINQHAHILFSGLDEDGRSVRRKLDKKMLRELQTITAETLGMERGKDVRQTKRKRLDTYQYKEAMRLKNAEVKQLEKQIKTLREEMKNFNAGQQGKEKEFTQADYKALAEIKRLLKANDLTEAVTKLNSFETEIKQRIKQRAQKLINKYAEQKGVFNKEEVLQKDVAVKIINAVCKTESINVISVLQENERLKAENEKLRERLLQTENRVQQIKKVANAKVSYYANLYGTMRTELEKYHKQQYGNYKKLNNTEQQIKKDIERKHNVKLNGPGF